MTGNNSALDKDAIYAHIRQTLIDTFDVPAEAINPEARLVDDLDIDSLDAIDLLSELGEHTGIKVEPEQFKDVKTIADVVAVIQNLADAKSAT